MLLLTSCGGSGSGSGGLVMIALQPIATGLSSPTFLTNARDGRSRLFILEQPGVIKVLQQGSSSPTDYLDISSRIVSGGEQEIANE